MPNVAQSYRQQETLQPGRYMLRHIAPLSTEAGVAGVINPLGAGFTVLAKTLYAEPLPMSRLPDSPDFHEGKYTLRMLDAGDYSLTFPNRDASDGRPWRERFSAEGGVEWVEVSREGEVEFVGVIDKLQKDRQKIIVEGYDGMFLLKKAYEQSFLGVMAPRDLIERYSELYEVSVGTQFTGALPAAWTSEITGGEGGTVTTTTTGVALAIQKAVNRVRLVCSTNIATSLAARWSVRAEVNVTTWNAEGGATLVLEVREGATVLAELNVRGNTQVYELANNKGGSVTLPSPATLIGHHTLLMECDGRWISAYVDGQLVGFVPAFASGAIQTRVALEGALIDRANAVTVSAVIAKTGKPFLMRGSEKGDYVLPGTASSYPTGGLHGRYIVNGATTSAEKWWETILAPDPRRSGFPTYIEGQLASLGVGPISGVPETYWAARWFGAIYLPLSKGNVSGYFQCGDGARVWIGKTQFGQALIDGWVPQGVTVHGFTVNAASLGGKDGWYPIIIEHFIGGTASGGNLVFAPPVTYTDPGGTEIKGGVEVVVPATSLSPLGCVDARIQGSSFFDIVVEQAKNAGYQLRCEPRQLESGEFPGRLVPQARLGRDTDEILEADDLDRKSGINNYAQTLDATDTATSLKAFGSGIADGKGSQIAFEAINLPAAANALFDMQAWLNAGDIAFPALLAARANAELSLRSSPWENITGEPFARDRLADTFPLTGALSMLHWLPGDGIRVWLPDVGVTDTAPRQILQVTRQITPEGRSGTQVGFRARPKDPLYALRSALRDVTRPARAYQKQYATRHGVPVEGALAAGAFTAYSELSLSPEEKVIAAVVHIAINSFQKTLGVEINGVDRTTTLGGPWPAPATINILPFAVPNGSAADQRLFVRLKNTSAEETNFVWFQVILTLLV